ncbi:MAG TPA: winged helix-turn-helix domain-containing protein [Chloroflexota bacterium]|jgi:DNA-binding winged helix-turn-helix (wHTH) protein/tetratricopeptide (TPR) repeat protein
MGRGTRFHDLVFDDDLLGAVRDDGRTLRLTRQERALIGCFLARPNRLLSRDYLLSALSEDPGDLSDRNVDFIVNRLRRKLGDTARQPRFIATQYGEGYVWVADPRPLETPALLLVVGPVRCASEAVPDPAKRLAAQLQTALEARTAPGRVLARPDWRQGQGAFRFSLAVDLFVEAGVPRGALTLRQEPGGAVVSVTSVDVSGEVSEDAAATLATTTLAAIWRHLTVSVTETAAPTDAPLQVRIHDAALLLNPDDETWIDIEPRLAASHAAHPEEPHTAIIWATHLAGLLMRRRAGDPTDPATYARIEDQVEGLVFAHLPTLQNEPVFLINCANLLVGVHRGHMDLAEELVRRALDYAPAFAMAQCVLGQIEAERGDLEGGLGRIDEALRWCDPGAEFELYVLVIKLRTLIAKGDSDLAEATFKRVRRLKPAAGSALAFLCLRPGEEALTADMRLTLGKMTPEEGRNLLGYQYYVNARRYTTIAHQRNILAGPVDHLVRRFGDEVMPDAVRALFSEG